ncbi:MAG: 2-C-methyl-D-erythritol 2,4-cyclodiphosphate synthase [Candidatus Gastranaerophilales bacterium]|nr:2-C-methyl-D-erythritol 2,4-cyclodiphosphate synthase [Candidatus Gastranaerophilales bacterium]
MREYRIGYGTDLHVLVENRDFILGGVKIPYEKGFKAHSDGDVLIHAIIDALFGALGLDDIGAHFPDNDPKYKNADSAKLLEETISIIRSKGWEINNLDTNVHAEAPKLRPHIDNIKNNLAKILKIDADKISVKAKTSEGVDAVGEKLAVRTDCVVLLYKQ